jgi:phosphoglucosamine mutase
MLRFGTDGVRGVALHELTEDFVASLADVAAHELGFDEVVIGRDTRESGPALAAAVQRGLHTAGARVIDLGVAPTPTVASVAASLGAAAVVVTASHNPYADNGIKIFGIGGGKLSDAQQLRIEQRLAHEAATPDTRSLSTETPPNDVSRRDELIVGYGNHITSAVGANALAGLSIVVDCANGAFSEIAPRVLVGLGAQVTVIHDEPNGRNINEACGATHVGSLCEAVRLHAADLGLAFDGDGDRVIAVDHRGTPISGDHILALSAIDMAASRKLTHDTVVVTVMTNAGFHSAMRDRGIGVVTTPVGDRNVLAAMEERGLVLGGEQSGHIIHRQFATTGDGLLAGALLAALVARSGRRLHDLAKEAMTLLPQSLINVSTPKRIDDPATTFADEIRDVEESLGGVGRVLLRASGTESMVRVMVEAATQEGADAAAQSLAETVERRLGSL